MSSLLRELSSVKNNLETYNLTLTIYSIFSLDIDCRKYQQQKKNKKKQKKQTKKTKKTKNNNNNNNNNLLL